MPEINAIEVDLSDEERGVLRAGLLEWGGPARPTAELAVAMGFGGLDGLRSGLQWLRDALERQEPLSSGDWRRVLVATEIVFASDVFGSGLDWAISTGFSDAETIALLRQIQRKLPRWRGSWQFTLGTDGDVLLKDTERPTQAGE